MNKVSGQVAIAPAGAALLMSFLALVLVLGGAFSGSRAQAAETAKPAEVAVTAKDKAGKAEVIAVIGPLCQQPGVRPLLGRDFLPADHKASPDAAIISADLWKELFASRLNVIGEKIHVADQERVIVGVMPAAFAGRKVWLAQQK